jgi:RNA polymerase sigma-70 factor (ECF subfamily)
METPDEFLPTRLSLLTRLKNWDDNEGWKRFFDTYWRLIYGTAIKSGLSDAEAQDVVQETVIAVAKKMNEFKYDPALGSFKGWLLTLTKWRISDQYRQRQLKEQVRRESPDETARTSVIESQADEQGLQLDAVWEAEWQNNLMAAAIDRVKRKVGARQYQLFDLYVIKQWAVEEVAKTLKVSVAQVYQAKSRITPLIRSEVEILEKKHL